MSPKDAISYLCLSLRHGDVLDYFKTEEEEGKTAEFDETSPKACYNDIASLEIKLNQMKQQVFCDQKASVV
ncbi:hypothetical protein RMATCC62417_11141 [Rhizopus microsporus]|nr:hypothetical protein RMATCC62417_11141 [Rhizopus microsporus]